MKYILIILISSLVCQQSYSLELVYERKGLKFYQSENQERGENIIEMSSNSIQSLMGVDLYSIIYASLYFGSVMNTGRIILKLDGQVIFTYEGVDTSRYPEKSLRESGGHHVQILLKKGIIEVLFHKIEYPSNSDAFVLRNLAIAQHRFAVDNAQDMAKFRKLYLADNEIVGVFVDYDENALTILRDLQKLQQQCPHTQYRMSIEIGNPMHTNTIDKITTFSANDTNISELYISTLLEMQEYKKLQQKAAEKVYGPNVSEKREKLIQKVDDERNIILKTI